MAVICSKDLIDIRDNYKSIYAELDEKLYTKKELLKAYKELKIEYENVLSDISEDQSQLLKILIPSAFGSCYFLINSESYVESDSKYFCLILSLIFISTAIEYMNGFINYHKKFNVYDHNKYKISEEKIDINYYNAKKRQVLNEMEKLELAIKTIDSFTEEEKIKYLKLKTGEDKYE